MVLSSKKNSQGVIRQGDVLIIPLNNSQLKGRKLPHLTLAKGEVTGHSHRISQGKAELYERNGTVFLRIISDTAKLEHEQHHALNIPRGDWMIKIQREYQPVAKTDNQLTDNLFLNKSSIPSQTLSSPENNTQSFPQSLSEKPDNLKDESDNLENEPDNLENESDNLENESDNLENEPKNLDDEIIQLANQVNSRYWDIMVKGAEQSREYLGRLQAEKSNFDQDDIQTQKQPSSSKKRKYVKSSDSNSNNDVVNHPSNRVSSAQRTRRGWRSIVD